MSATVVLDPSRLAADEVTVEGDAYRHLFRARRLAVGDRLRAVDGAGAARWAEVVSVDRRTGTLRLLDPAPAREPAYRLELLVGTPKKDRAATLVEKATEVGVAAVRFVATERSPRDFGAGTLERLARVAVAAVEQCGRSRVPELSGVHGWDELPDLLAAAPDRWLLDTDPGAGSIAGHEQGAGSGPGPEAWPAAGAGEAAAEGRGVARPSGAPELAPWRTTGDAGAVLIGPEGGWSGAEVEELRGHGCRSVWLGERVLRVETAAVVASAAVLLL